MTMRSINLKSRWSTMMYLNSPHMLSWDIVCVCFETGSQDPWVVWNSSCKTRLSSNSQMSICLCLLSTEIKGVYHHALLRYYILLKFLYKGQNEREQLAREPKACILETAGKAFHFRTWYALTMWRKPIYYLHSIIYFLPENPGHEFSWKRY